MIAKAIVNNRPICVINIPAEIGSIRPPALQCFSQKACVHSPYLIHAKAASALKTCQRLPERRPIKAIVATNAANGQSGMKG